MSGRRDRRAVTLLAVWLTAAAMAPARASDPANDPRVQEVAEKLLCYCGCSTQSVAACSCGVARKERANIQTKLDSGATSEEVIAEWVELRGTGILIEPPRQGFNLLGWFLPSIVLLLAGLALIFQIRRWARQGPAATAAGPAAPLPDPRYLQQIQRDLENLER